MLNVLGWQVVDLRLVTIRLVQLAFLKPVRVHWIRQDQSEASESESRLAETSASSLFAEVVYLIGWILLFYVCATTIFVFGVTAILKAEIALVASFLRS